MHATPAPAPARGSPHLSERLAANLVGNALQHNVPGGRLDVSSMTVGSRAVLSVSNTGRQASAAALTRLFQPFQRLSADRTNHSQGLCLGPSIVRAIAETHGATISASPRPGGGLLIEVTFPDPRTGHLRPRPVPQRDHGIPAADGTRLP